MKTIALCINVESLDEGGYRYPSICKKYPGSSWLPHLLRQEKYKVLSGLETLDAVYAGAINPKDVLVFQEENNWRGRRLIQDGATPAIITCFESKMYTPDFYDRINDHAYGFKRSLFFSGGTDHLTFPIYEEDQIQPLVPWMERKEMVIVVSNKHYSALPDQKDSPSFQEALRNQLHDLRYDSISYFKSSGALDLYGHGWTYDDAFAVNDKVETMRKYKFSLCIENVSLPGYVTEKIIDCFVAGVVPIYAGPPDIYDYIPGGSFITIDDYLKTTPNEDRCMNIIDAGRKFLQTHTGRLHSNKGFADNIIRLMDEISQ